MAFDLYQEITNRILEALQNGVAPWAQPWNGKTVFSEVAISHTTGKPYSLLNQLLLHQRGEYLTFKQCKDEGGKVKSGEKAKLVVFWKWLDVEKEDKDGNVKVEQIPFLRYYNVFHIDQCEGIEPKHANEVERYEGKPVEAAEKVFADYISREGIGLSVGDSSKAYYQPATDFIRLPGIDQFKCVEEYYSTAFHEATHSTGHETRLNRLKDCAAFGSETYSKEELVAELGSCFILGRLGISTDTSFRNSAAYIQGWLKALKNDKRLVVSAAGAAEKAARFIMGEG